MSLDEVARDFANWSTKTDISLDPSRQYERVREEMLEFLDDPCADEAADVFLTLLNWCRAHGISLEQAASTKMRTNWKRGRRPSRRDRQGDHRGF